MATVTVSPKSQIVIPQKIRESSGIVPGQKVQMISCRSQIRLIPIEPMENLRGFLKGIDTHVEREG
ncbi:MAG: AbrB/MazE/SpoVT family DNA-binding domain-containing protein [Gammaproteobacteria bacterium]|nr:AbrB/MazE/SpoVT family DNA-binding domain-containing protein [Gammaproteobacteria bacterium]